VKQRINILALGEVLWDYFPDGARFGGAPANFACHCAALGAQTSLGTRIGADELGRLAGAFLDERQIDTQAIQVDEQYPTGIVDVQLDDFGKPTFTIREGVAWDHLQPSAELDKLCKAADAIYFGTLSQRSPETRSTILQLVTSESANRLCLLDLNLRVPFYDTATIDASLQAANALKINDSELATVGEALEIPGSEFERLETLRQRYELRLLALTRGTEGSCLMTADQLSERPRRDVPVVDTVGAGDAFTAALAVGHLSNLPLDQVHEWAIELATFVCGQAGAVPALPARLQHRPV
jgi:fructokinase